MTTVSRHSSPRSKALAVLCVAVSLSFLAGNSACAADKDAKTEDKGAKAGKGAPPGTVMSGVIQDFQRQKEKFLSEQKESKNSGKDVVKDELKGKTVVHTRREAKDAIAAARERAREQARKLAEEAKEQNSGGGRSRD